MRLTGSFEGSGVREYAVRRPLAERLQLKFWIPLLVLATAPVWISHLVWRAAPPAPERVVLVDYTVPFVSAREHRSTVWLLNHAKFAPPAGPRWEILGCHIGYDPGNRSQPQSVHELDLWGTDWVVVADAYGVYQDDLRDVTREIGHMDYSPRVFGGMSREDSEALRGFTDAGGHVLLESNALEDPTPPEARAVLSTMLGVEWTGWVGRVFPSLADTTDVPRWFADAYERAYGSDRLPRTPVLMLIHRDGRMRVLTSQDASRITPRIVVTDAGRRALGGARGNVPYFAWFPVLRAGPGTEELAELELPSRREDRAVLDSLDIPARIPLITRRVEAGSHRVYVGADLSDIDFKPGAYRFAGIARLKARTTLTSSRRPDGSQVFWRFTVPAYRALLEAPRGTRPPP